MSRQENIKIWKTDHPRVFLNDGKEVTVPENWVFVPAGDAGLTRRLKNTTVCWTVVHRRKNRIEAVGSWCDEKIAEQVRRSLKEERDDPSYLRRMEKVREKRIAMQDAYVVEFRQAVVDFLDFAPKYNDLAWEIADAVTDLAVPVGSGTVARSSRLPLTKRAEAAVIAWMRHQTTDYDNMHIANKKGARSAVRKELAANSRKLLEILRRGENIPENTLLFDALR